MDVKNQKTRNKIISAALAVIGQQGTEHITSRAIAAEAKINHAAINYHFESKEALIKQTLAYFQEGIRNVFSILEDASVPAAERLLRFAKELIRYNSAYPGVKHQMLSRLMVKRETDKELTERIIIDLTAIESTIGELQNPPQKKNLRFLAISFFSSLVYPLFLSRFGSDVIGSEYGDNEMTEDYIRTLIKSISEH